MSETTPTPSLAIVRPFIMQALQNIMSNEETRYYLRGVLIEPHKNGGIVLTATDGHVLVTMHDALGYAEGKPRIWAFRDHATLVKAQLSTATRFNKDKAMLKYQQVGDSFQVSFGYADSAEEMLSIKENGDLSKIIAFKAAIDGTFPDYSRVMSAVGPDRAGSSFQAGILIRIAKFAQEITSNKASPVNLELTSESGPSHFHVTSESFQLDAVGVIMPMRGERMLHHPIWCSEHLNRPDMQAPIPEEMRQRRRSKEDAPEEAAADTKAA